MTNFPTTLDGFQNPGASTTMDAAGFEHDAQHANVNDAIAALQAKVGINGSGDPSSLDYKMAQCFALLFNANSQVQLTISGGQVVVPRGVTPVAQAVTMSHSADLISSRRSSHTSSTSLMTPCSCITAPTSRILFQNTEWNQCST